MSEGLSFITVNWDAMGETTKEPFPMDPIFLKNGFVLSLLILYYSLLL